MAMMIFMASLMEVGIDDSDDDVDVDHAEMFELVQRSRGSVLIWCLNQKGGGGGGPRKTNVRGKARKNEIENSRQEAMSFSCFLFWWTSRVGWPAGRP